MPLTAEAVINRALFVLNDDQTAPARWTKAQLLVFVNDGQRQIVQFKPDANPATAVVKLSAGTRQSIPSGQYQLVDIVRNMGTAGTTPGPPVSLIDRKTLDEEIPDWHASGSSATVKHYCFDDRAPTVFFVYPAQPVANQGYVEMVTSVPPGEALLTAPITLNDIYANSLVDYILYRALSVNAEHADSLNRSMAHWNAFLAGIGRMDLVQKAAAPRR